MTPEPAHTRLSWAERTRVFRAATGLVWSASPGTVTALALVAVLAGLLPPATAWLQREVLNALASSGTEPSRPQGLAWLVVALAVVGICTAVVPQGQQYMQGNLRRRVKSAAFDAVYRAVASWPGITRFESPEFADKLQLTSQLAQSSASSLVNSAFSTGQSLVAAASFLVTLLVVNPVLATMIATTQCLAIAAGLTNARRQAQLTLRNSIRSRRQQAYGALLCGVTTAKEIRLFGLDGLLRGRMLTELAAANLAEGGLARRLLRVESGLAALSSAVVAGGLAWTITRVAAHELPIGDVSLFVLAAMGMQGSINQIATALGGIAQSVTMFSAYVEVVSAPPDLPVAGAASSPGPLSHGITIEDVWFRYDESHPWVLRGISMFIPAGSRVALVGLNGSGKSTLVKLLCRMYDPARGCIRWDGTDIRQLDPAALRTRLSGVFQDYTVYELTVAENIGIGDLNALDDRQMIRRAAELSGADAAIARMPDGYDTMLSRVFLSGRAGEGARIGVLVSGGQGQRVALARALMRAGRDLMIVDEPMASLDAEAEHEIHQRLAAAAAGRTCVLISHRLASVRDADQIFVLSDGAVAEQGAHAELMATGGIYARLFTMQAAGYQAVAVVPR